MTSSNRNTSTLPQGFSIYQPTLGAQLQFLPVVGTVELDELINAYVTGNASTQEKRASVSLDFLEYAHVTGQTFKFYPVYSVSTPVKSPATDSGYGSSFNVSPVASSWDFSQLSTSCSPTSSQQVRRSPKAASSRHQGTDLSNLPGMKIMTKDGRDVTNSASRGSKTKEQRDHAHLMRIIKACDSCRRKKIRCDPSHKKRAASQSQSKSTAKSTRKAKAVAEAVQVAASTPPPVDSAAPASALVIDQYFGPVDLESATPSLSALEPWEELIEYPPVGLPTDYDFFYDPEGYFSPESSSSRSTYSTKPVTPTSQQEIAASYNLPAGESVATSSQLPFNQTESIHDYVDFNLFSPESSFSEDDNMVSIELSRHLSNQSQSQQSDTIQHHSPVGSDLDSDVIGNALDTASWSMSPRQSGEDEHFTYNIYRDPGTGGVDCSPSPTGLSSDMHSQSIGVIDEASSLPVCRLDVLENVRYDVIGHPTGDGIERPRIGSVSPLDEFREPIASNAPHVGTNIVSDNNASGTAWHIAANNEPNSRVDTQGGLFEIGSTGIERTLAADSTFATNNCAHSDAVTAASGLEGETNITGTLTISTAIANNPAETNAAIVTGSPLASVFTTATTISVPASPSDALAPVDTLFQSLNELQAHDNNTFAITSRSATSSVEESSVSRGTEAYASVISSERESLVSLGTETQAFADANIESFAPSLSENTVAESNEISGELETPSSHGKYGPRNTQSQPPLVQQDHSIGTDRTNKRPETYYAPCASTNGGDFVSLSSLMTGAMLSLATVVFQSFIKRYVGAILYLLFAAVGQSIQSSNAPIRGSNRQQIYSEPRRSLVDDNYNSLDTRTWNRFATLRDQTSLGLSSVNLAIMQGARLIAI